MAQKCEKTLQCFPPAFSVHECEKWSFQGMGCDSAERTAGTDIAKLNTTVRRQLKNGRVISALHRTATFVGMY